VRLFENIMASYMGRETEICACKNRCGSYVVVEYNGDVYRAIFLWKAVAFGEEPVDIHR
jgi:sulfatase maturation enzyme AslB (radical SAM superfamily)